MSGGLETLEHIFIQCPHTNIFKNILNTFIKNKIDREYRDNRNYHFNFDNMSRYNYCNHANPMVNYINLTAKWYISRNFQQYKPLIWDEFVRYTKFALNGDEIYICIVLKQ